MPNVLIVGSGAREHAIVKALIQSHQQPVIFCCATTRNPGILSYAKQYWIGDICHPESIVEKALEWQIDLAIIGPEAPLEKGVADALWGSNIPTVGPKKNLALLESSKAFARDLLEKYHIPGSPEYRVFIPAFDKGGVLTSAKQFLQQLGEGNYVIKADGLMNGKGVKVAGDHLHSLEEAYQFCAELHSQRVTFVIEKKLIGQEFSLLCFCDGHTLIPMPVVQDHKRAFVDDKGPNTGGMGSYSDANHLLPFLKVEEVEGAQAINQAVINILEQIFPEKYIGILYGSFIATQEGVRLIEYNVRFGDPEVMNVLAILETDLLMIFQAMVNGALHAVDVNFLNLATVCKYAVPEGYPDASEKNFLIDVTQIENDEQLYFAGVNFDDQKLYATGARAVAVVGIADTLQAAEKIAEQEICKVKGNLFHRADIGTEKLIQQSVRNREGLRND